MDSAIGTLTTPPAPVRQTPAGEVQIRVQSSGATPSTGDCPATPWTEIAARADRRFTAERQVDTDAATGSLVFRLVDVASGLVTSQTPSEARLKLRVYLDSVIAGKRPSAPSVERTA